MSEYTTRQILDMIEANGGPKGLDLSEKNLSGIDLSPERIQAELEKVREEDPEAEPVWLDAITGGINLARANLQEARLKGARLQSACLYRADLKKAKLAGARLQWVSLQRANLREADLMSANLQGATLVLADLQGTTLWGCDLREVNLRFVASLQGAFFYGARLDHTEMDQVLLGPSVGEELVGHYDLARDAYLRLKRNFGELGDYSAVRWAYIKERRMEGKCSAPWRARRFYGKSQLRDSHERKLTTRHPLVLRFYARHTLKWLSDWFVDCLCVYGESVWRVLVWMFASFFGFAAYYWHIGGVWLVEPNGRAKVASSFWHHLIYSLGAFTTTQFARFQAADDRVRLITGIQAIIGIALAGLFGFVAGNRIRRS